MTRRLRIGVLFGGRSGEHEVSLASGEAVLAGLRASGKYDVLPIGIDRDGRWRADPRALERLAAEAEFRLPDTAFRADAEAASGPPAAWVPGVDAPLTRTTAAGAPEALGLDVVFPVLHGPYGEDGTVQGLCETVGIPYVGCGVASSAVAMDKDLAKSLLRDRGIPVVPWTTVRAHEWEDDREGCLARARELGMPCFVKPANMGSSVGISKVGAADALAGAIDHALQFDRKVLVEAAVDAREIEVAVLGNDRPEASVPGEIVPSGEFYDYDAKYLDGASTLKIPAPLEPATTDRIRATAIEVFRMLEGSGLARVDFLLNERGGDVYVNEMNTMPGFTSISMYAKLWAATGVPYEALLDRLIELALERHRARRALHTRPDRIEERK